MIGIDMFKQYFKGHENEYIIIGGTACELLMSHEELPFRATKDIDMVLIIESLTKEFVDIFWKFVKEADYQYINKGTGKAQFYRFSHPKSSTYPTMIELFSKNQEWISEEALHITPIHIDDAVSSLSAILLNETYYDFLTKGTSIIDEIPILNAEHIIPFKAKAWIDLTQRKNLGEHVDSHNIKKHKNDIFRLSLLLTPDQRIELPHMIKQDMILFITMMFEEDVNLKQLGIIGTNKKEILKLLSQIYDIQVL